MTSQLTSNCIYLQFRNDVLVRMFECSNVRLWIARFSVGLSEEEAIEKYGEDGIEVYHSKYDTLEMQGAHRMDLKGNFITAACYSKLICERTETEKVVGGGYYHHKETDVFSWSSSWSWDLASYIYLLLQGFPYVDLRGRYVSLTLVFRRV